jgi:uncharacterized membrane-anchored protein YhcB (DUF1043 family)
LDTALQDLLKAVAPPEISPELRAQRTKVSGIQALQEEQAQEDARRIREEVVRTGQRRMDRANLPFFDDPQALLAVAGAIDKRKGYELGSLSTGLASALAAQEARKEKAEEYVATSSEKVRALNNTYRQLQLENAKYQQALLENDTKTARESAEKITKLRYDAAVKAQELQNDRIRADAAQAKAHAAGIAAGAQAAAVPSRTEAAAQAANARLVSAINNDTMLQVYRKQLEDPLQAPNATAIENKIKTRLNELLLQYAPELTISGIGSADAGSKTRRDADAIIKQGKQ